MTDLLTVPVKGPDLTAMRAVLAIALELAAFAHDCRRRGMMDPRTPGDSTGSHPEAVGRALLSP